MQFDKKKIFFGVGISFLLLISIIWLVIRAFNEGVGDHNRLYYIGRDSTWYPVDLRGKEKNLVGFATDLIQAVGKESGFRSQVVEVGPNALFDGLNIQNYDAIFSSLQPSPLNLERYSFSNPFYLIGPVLLVRKDSDIDSLSAMKGKILGVETNVLQTLDVSYAEDIVILPFRTTSEALENLDNNFVDAVIVDALRAYTYADGFYASRLRVATDPITNKGFRLVSRSTPASIKLIALFNEGLKVVREKGLYQDLVRKWELIDTDVDSTEDS